MHVESRQKKSMNVQGNAKLARDCYWTSPRLGFVFIQTCTYVFDCTYFARKSIYISVYILFPCRQLCPLELSLYQMIRDRKRERERNAFPVLEPFALSYIPAEAYIHVVFFFFHLIFPLSASST